MSNPILPGLAGSFDRPRNDATPAERLVIQHPLHHVLAFTGRSIHDVVNNPLVKNQVLGYFKLHKQVQRACEVVDLERWWNGSR